MGHLCNQAGTCKKHGGWTHCTALKERNCMGSGTSHPCKRDSMGSHRPARTGVGCTWVAGRPGRSRGTRSAHGGYRLTRIGHWDRTAWCGMGPRTRGSRTPGSGGIQSRCGSRLGIGKWKRLDYETTKQKISMRSYFLNDHVNFICWCLYIWKKIIIR